MNGEFENGIKQTNRKKLNTVKNVILQNFLLSMDLELYEL